MPGRVSQVTVKGALSRGFVQEWGVQKGSCLGRPLLLILHAYELFQITDRFLPKFHVSTDDKQLYTISFSPTEERNENREVFAIKDQPHSHFPFLFISAS